MNPTERRPVGQYAPDFELPSVDGEVYHLTRYREQFVALGIAFICNHCPAVQTYLERLKQIQADFAERQFTLIGINPNDAVQVPDDSFENMKAFAASQALNFPYLRDPSQDVARAFGAERTPEIFLLDQSGVVRYRGGIDDSPNAPAAATANYLRTAIAQLLDGEPIATPVTEAIGCEVKWRR